MSELDDRSKEEESSSLANRLFGEAPTNNAKTHLERGKEDLSRGATDQADEHLRRALGGIGDAFTNMTSPRLTEPENKEWLRLQQKKYLVGENGVTQVRLSEGQELRLKFLNQKAFGHEVDGETEAE